MTNEELIIGHYEHSLTPDQERMLQERINQSAETRAMYDQYGQHGTLDAALTADASTLKPSSRLDEVTIAAALSLVPEAIGGGSLFGWLSGKVAIGITAVLVGGVSIAIISDSDSSPKPAPAVQRTVPATPPAQVPQPVTSQPEAPQVQSGNAGAEAPAHVAPVERSASRSVDPAGSPRRNVARRNTRPSGLTIDSQNAPTLQTPTKMNPKENK